MNNEDDCRDILVPSSDEISTVGASSSPDLSEPNLPSQSAVFSPVISDLELLESCPVALASAPEEWSCLTDLLPRSVNAEVEVSDTKVPQGNAHLQIHYMLKAHAACLICLLILT